MEFLTFSMIYSMLQTHQELLRRYHANRASQAELAEKAHYLERATTALGELLIRVGTRLKEHSYRRLPSEEASAPNYLIML